MDYEAQQKLWSLVAAVVVAVLLAVFAPWLLGLLFSFFVLLALRWPPLRDWFMEWADILWKRWYWRKEEGRHHTHRGVQLDIDDDGRQMWISGDSVMRVLDQHEAADVLAARHSGRWKRGQRGALWLRVDAVVERLAQMPGRMDPKVVRFRRYLQEDVLFPAAERRRRAGQGDSVHEPTPSMADDAGPPPPPAPAAAPQAGEVGRREAPGRAPSVPSTAPQAQTARPAAGPAATASTDGPPEVPPTRSASQSLSKPPSKPPERPLGSA